MRSARFWDTASETIQESLLARNRERCVIMYAPFPFLSEQEFLQKVKITDSVEIKREFSSDLLPL